MIEKIKVNILLSIFLLNLFLLTGCSFIKNIIDVTNESTNIQESDETSKIIYTNESEVISVIDKELWYEEADDYSIETMYLTVSEGNSGDNTNHTWQEVNNYSIFYYDELGIERYAVEGLLQVGDKNGPVKGELGYDSIVPNARVNVRGNTTSAATQKSYKIELDKGKGLWREQRTIILNKHIWDPTRIRNKLSYDLMRDIPGMISSRSQFVHLYVKDLTSSNMTRGKFIDYGLYTQVEQFNNRFLRNHGFDDGGHLYKAEMFEFFRYKDDLKLKTDQDYDLKKFEKVVEIKGNDDHGKLLEMLDDINNPSIPITESFPKYFDEENYFTWMAFHILIGNRDTTNRNFYLYSPLNSKKWYFISWDNDGGWNVDRSNQDLKSNGHEIGISNYWGVVLHQRVLKNNLYREKLDEKIIELKNYLTPSMLKERIDKYANLITPYSYREPDIDHMRLPIGQFKKYINDLPSTVELNYKLYEESINRPMPFFIGVPTNTTSGKIRFNWDIAYDLDNEKITYDVTISDSYLFDNIIYESKSGLLPVVETDLKLKNGNYFVRVIAKNQSGFLQTSFDYYVDENSVKHYGVLPFVVENGDIDLLHQ